MLTVNEILSACGGELLFGNKNTGFTAVTVNSGEVKRGYCFAAVQGERHDGNDFIAEAIEKGASLILSEKHPVTYGGLYGLIEKMHHGHAAFILVDGIYEYLARLAKYYRENCLEKVVAVTGSVGKTTVKELVHSVLSERLDVYKTEGNKNNLLGLSLSVLSGNTSKNIVLELGISNKGEMEGLSRVAQPNVSVITNIGNAHSKFLALRENTALEKLKIVCGMKDGGVLIINGDEPLLTDNARSESVMRKCPKTVTVSEKDGSADILVYNTRVTPSGTFFSIKRKALEPYKDLFVPIVGRHGAFDGAFAVAVGFIFGCSEENIRNGLLKYTPCGDRQRVEEIDGILCVFDCYNASPESFSASLEALSILSEGKKKVCVVAGSMLELGDKSESAHEDIGKEIASLGTALLIAVGKEAKGYCTGALNGGMKNENIIFIEDEDSIGRVASVIKTRLHGESVLLIKGSRRMRLERLRGLLSNEKFPS